MVLDSGYTSNMCHDKNKFFDSEKFESKNLNLAINATTQIEAKGTVKLLFTDSNQVKSLNLKDTSYVPDLRTHLLVSGKDNWQRLWSGFQERISCDSWQERKWKTIRRQNRGIILHKGNVRSRKYCIRKW